MTIATKFLDKFAKQLKLSIHTFAPANVVRADLKTADIQLLFKTKYTDGTSSITPMIKNVPVLKHVGLLEPGDMVFVAFSERGLDNLSSTPFVPNSIRTHSYVDAVVIGAW